MKSIEASDMMPNPELRKDEIGDKRTGDNRNSVDHNTGHELSSGNPELLVTRDGSHTVLIPSLDITYRSRHGAIQESMHVFIDAGLRYKWSQQAAAGSALKELNLFEVGFGTGLNALLSCQEALRAQSKICYTAIEPSPLKNGLVEALNYPDQGGYLQTMHGAGWNEFIEIHPFFLFRKYNATLAGFEPGHLSAQNGNKQQADLAEFDLIYFDVFGPVTQPELWSAESFEKVASLMKPGAVLTTYCSKSVVRKTMMSAGLKVAKIQGPYGKREMVRAIR